MRSRPQLRRKISAIFLFVLLALGMFSFLSMQPVSATVWNKYDDFETGTHAAFWLGADPYTVVSTTAYVYEGLYGAKSSSDSNYWHYAMNGSGTKYWQFRYKIVPNPQGPPTGNSGGVLIEWYGPTSWMYFSLYVNTGYGHSYPFFQIQNSSSKYVNGVHDIHNSTWYNIVIAVTIQAGNKTLSVYVDNILDCTIWDKSAPSTFTQFYIYAIQWTFGRDCRTALDNFGESNTYPGRLSVVDFQIIKQTDTGPVQVNNGGDLDYIYVGDNYIFRAIYSDSDGWDIIDQTYISFNDSNHNTFTVGANSTGTYIPYSGTATMINVMSISVYNMGAYELYVDYRVSVLTGIFDSVNVQAYGSCNATTGEYIISTPVGLTFNIYNSGGYMTYDYSGDAGLTVAGDTFDMYADANSYIRVDQVWRDIKGVDAIFALNPVGNRSFDPGKLEDARNIGQWEFGLDYVMGDSWVTSPLYVAMYLTDSDVGYKNLIPTPDSWMQFDIYWTSFGVTIKHDKIIGWYEGPALDLEQMRIRVRFWYNQANSSSVIGGWVSPLYYGPTSADGWSWISGSAKPKYPFNQSSVGSFAFTNIKFSNGTITTVGNVKLTRLWAEIDRNGLSPSYVYNIASTEKLNFYYSTGPYGIPTPEPIEPWTPDIPRAGIFGFAISAIGMIYQGLSYALSQSMDALMEGMFGRPHMFSDMATAISSTLIGLWSMLSSIPGAIANFAIFIFTAIAIINTLISNILTLITWFLNFIGGMLGVFINIMTVFISGGTIFGVSVPPLYWLFVIAIIVDFIYNLEDHGMWDALTGLGYWFTIIYQVVQILYNIISFVIHTLLELLGLIKPAGLPVPIPPI